MILIVIEKRISCIWTITTGHAVSNTTAQKTPVFLVKQSYGLGGTPLYRQNFQRKGGYGFGGYSPPFRDKIRKVVFDVAPKTSQFFFFFKLCIGDHWLPLHIQVLYKVTKAMPRMAK